MGKTTTRCFIALDIPEESSKEITRLQDEIKKQNLFVGKYIKPENIHLTLKFLGEIDEEKREEVKARLQKVCFNKFILTLNNVVGVFSEKFIRIIWVKVAGEKVYDLQKKIDEALEGLFPKEQRFMGHITIARVKKVTEKKALLELLKKLKTEKKECSIQKFTFKSSELTPLKTLYKDIETYACKAL